MWMTQSNFAAKGKVDYRWEGKWSSRWEDGREGWKRERERGGEWMMKKSESRRIENEWMG